MVLHSYRPFFHGGVFSIHCPDCWFRDFFQSVVGLVEVLEVYNIRNGAIL